jgi:DNA-binding beta-propeller fold protein YncE
MLNGERAWVKRKITGEWSHVNSFLSLRSGRRLGAAAFCMMAAVVAFSVVMAGCGSGSGGLSAGLQAASGSAEAFRFSTTSVGPGAVNQPYSQPVITTLSDTKQLTNCSVTSGELPAGLVATISPSSSQSCLISGTPLMIETSTFTLSAVDNSTPQRSTSIALSITVASGLALAPNFVVLPNAVQSRPYGGKGFTQLVYTVSGGQSPYTLSATGGPSGLTCAQASAITLTCSSGTGAITGSAGPYKLVISVTDTGTSSTPPQTVTLTQVLNVDAPLSLQQNMSPPPAIEGRAYGQGANCSLGNCVPLVYTAAGGLANSSGNYHFSESGLPKGFSCIGETPGSEMQALDCSSSDVTASPGKYSLTITVVDTANQTTPAGSPITLTPAPVMNVDAALVLQQNISPPAAVSGRRYGQGAGCSGGNCTPLIYTSSGGLSGYGFTESGLPTGLACTHSSNTLTCSSGGITGNPGIYTLMITATDAGNVSTPSGSASLSPAMTVDAVLALQPNMNPPDAVQGRAYGQGSNCSAGSCIPLIYTASAGLSNYRFTKGGLPAGLNCVQSPNATLTCSSGNGTGGITGNPGMYTLKISAADTADVSTPPSSVTLSASLTVDAALQIITSVLPNGLLGYSYYQLLAASGGLGGYVFAGPGSLGTCTAAGTLPPPLTVTAGALAGIPTAASTDSTEYTFQLCAEDTANVSTLSGSSQPSSDITVNIINAYAYVAEPGVDQVELVNTLTNVPTGITIPLPTASGANSVALTPDGRFAYVTLSRASSAQMVEIDTITNSLTPISLTGCVEPTGVAVAPVAVTADGVRAYIACRNDGEAGGAVAVIDVSTNQEVTAPFTRGGGPFGAAISPDGTRAYVTLTANSRLVSFDNTTTPPTIIDSILLDISASTPTGIAVANVPGETNVYAYIAMLTGPNGFGAVEVYDVTNVTQANGPVFVKSILFNIGSPAGNSPLGIAVTPDNMFVYVTLNGSNQYAVISNILSPVQILGSPFSLSGSSNAPSGVTIPPLCNSADVPPVCPQPQEDPFLAYLDQSASANVAVINTSTQAQPGPIPLTPNSNPAGIAGVPVPVLVTPPTPARKP